MLLLSYRPAIAATRGWSQGPNVRSAQTRARQASPLQPRPGVHPDVPGRVRCVEVAALGSLQTLVRAGWARQVLDQPVVLLPVRRGGAGLAGHRERLCRSPVQPELP